MSRSYDSMGDTAPDLCGGVYNEEIIKSSLQ